MSISGRSLRIVDTFGDREEARKKHESAREIYRDMRHQEEIQEEADKAYDESVRIAMHRSKLHGMERIRFDGLSLADKRLKI